MRQQYCNQGDAFLLGFALNSQVSLRELLFSFWPDVIRYKNYVRPPMILVGAKVDLEDQIEVSPTCGEFIARIFGCPYIETSALNYTNIDVCFDILVRELVCDDNGYKVKCLFDTWPVPSDFSGLLYNKKVYMGEIRNGKKNGVGLSWKNTSAGVATYLGEWVDDKKCGYGFLNVVRATSVVYSFAGHFLDNAEASERLSSESYRF